MILDHPAQLAEAPLPEGRPLGLRLRDPAGGGAHRARFGMDPEQLLDTAVQAARQGVGSLGIHVHRSGLYRPGDWCSSGEAVFRLVAAVQEASGLPVAWCDLEMCIRDSLCPAPGYDRHFRITESFGAELIPIAMTETGPDMDRVEELVRDPAVKGIWCVPKYSNPDGIVYSQETIRRLAGLRPAAPDFVLMWDNAYCMHEFDGPYVPFPDILTLCREAGNPDMVFEFASTSKITLPGAGMSVMAASEANIQYMQKRMGVQMISYDKVNQLRHVLYLQDRAHTCLLYTSRCV